MADAPPVQAEGSTDAPDVGGPAKQTHPPPSLAPEGPQERRAREFIEQAEKKIKSSQSFFGGLFGWALGHTQGTVKGFGATLVPRPSSFWSLIPKAEVMKAT